MKLLLTLIFAFCTLVVQGQAKFNLDKEMFLIGTLDDYMGHQQTFNAHSDSFYYKMVDIYFQQEKNIALFIKKLFVKDHPDLRLEDNGASKGLKLYSDSLSGIINSYFNFKPSGSQTLRGDVIYTGYLNKNKFITPQQKLSFLAGAYFRNSGSTSDYRLSIPNSTSKAKVCEQLLNQLGCKNVTYEMRRGIPARHFITFEPTPVLLKIFETIDQYKLNHIADSILVKSLFKLKY